MSLPAKSSPVVVSPVKPLPRPQDAAVMVKAATDAYWAMGEEARRWLTSIAIPVYVQHVLNRPGTFAEGMARRDAFVGLMAFALLSPEEQLCSLCDSAALQGAPLSDGEASLMLADFSGQFRAFRRVWPLEFWRMCHAPTVN